MCERSQILIVINHIYRLWLVLLITIFFFFNDFSFCADSIIQKDSLVQNLIVNGFENVRIKLEERKVFIAFENRVYRFEIDGIKKVLEIIVPLISDCEEVILIPQNRKIPLVVISVKVSQCEKFISGELSSAEFADKLNIQFSTDAVWQELKNETEFNSSDIKFDVTIKPTVAAQFGVFSDPVMWQLNIVPGIKTSFWKGMIFNYELIVPLHNDLLPLEDSVRIGLAVVNQTIRLPNSFFVSTTAGYFSNNRYGFDFETKKFFSNGDINLDFNLGCTSFATFAGTKIYYSDQFTWTGSVSAEYRIPIYDLTLGVMAGRFLMGDESVRFDINREFGEIEIGFFAIRSKSGISNGGFNISIPIFPAKYWKPSFVRIRPVENFTFSYLVRSNIDDMIGLRYNTGNRLNLFIEKLNPEFIKNSFRKNY